MNSKPEELDSLDRKIRQIEIEMVAIKREMENDKVEQLNKELSNLKEERNTIYARWSQEKELVDKIQFNKEEIENHKLQADKAELEVRELEQSLVSVERITEEWGGYAANVRSKLLALPSKISHRVQSAESYAEAEKILKDALYDALYELSNNGL